MVRPKEDASYDYAAFSVLVYEFPGDDTAASDRKIKSALRRKHLGAFDEARIQVLRRLRDKLRSELKPDGKSQYFRGPTSQFSSPDDFDQVRLAADLAAEFPKVDRHDLGRAVSLALYVYYLR